MGANNGTHPTIIMTMQNEDGIKREGVSIEDMTDDELIDKATNPDDGEDHSESSTDETEDEKEEPSGQGEEGEPDNTDEDKNIPFHKHPRFKEVINEKNDLSEKLTEANKRLDALEKPAEKPEDEPIAGWFKELYGDNEEAWKIYNAQSKKDRESIKEEVMSEVNELKDVINSQKEEKDRNQWVKDEVSSLIDEGHKFDENKFLKFMVDYKPSDDKGNISFKKGIELYNKVEGGPVKKDKTVRKKVAEATIGANKSSGDTPKYGNSGISHKSFSSLVDED